jgi:hypothetical protein
MKMLAPVPVRAELGSVLGLGQAWEVPGQARVLGLAERPARQRLVQVWVTRIPLFPHCPLCSWQQGDSREGSDHSEYKNYDDQHPGAEQHHLAYQVRTHQVIPAHSSLLSSLDSQKEQQPSE